MITFSEWPQTFHTLSSVTLVYIIREQLIEMIPRQVSKLLHLILKLSIVYQVLALMTTDVYGQVPTIQDCLGAIPICTEIYEEDFVTMGAGNYPNEINPVTNSGGISCMDQEVSSIWYTFTVNRSGDFGFLLTPNDPNDDYDWALFNITDADCADIFSNPRLQVSL